MNLTNPKLKLVMVSVAVLALCGGLVGWTHYWNTPEHGNVSFDVAPDGKRIAFAAADGNLYSFDLNTRRVATLVETSETKLNPSFSPDGKLLLYASQVGDDGSTAIFLYASNSGTSLRLTPGNGFRDVLPSFSPDGTKIVFARASRRRLNNFGGWRWDNWDVWQMHKDGSNLQQITWGRYSTLTSPRLMNDGRDIVYSGDLPYDGKFFSLTNGGSFQTLLSAEAGSTNSPQPALAAPPPGLFIGAWATDLDVDCSGREVLFISDRLQPFHYDIFKWQRENNSIVPLGLTAVSRYNQNPRWLPGEQAILFLAATKWNSHSRPLFSLWRANADGSNPRQLADTSLFTSPRSATNN